LVRGVFVGIDVSKARLADQRYPNKSSFPQTGVDVIADMQNSHMGLSMQYAEQIDAQAPQSQQDAAVMAFPASLCQVMK
jgi:hypothetical protein